MSSFWCTFWLKDHKLHPNRAWTWRDNGGGGVEGVNSLLCDSPVRAMNNWTKKTPMKKKNSEDCLNVKNLDLHSKFAFKICILHSKSVRGEANTIVKGTPKTNILNCFFQNKLRIYLVFFSPEMQRRLIQTKVYYLSFHCLKRKDSQTFKSSNFKRTFSHNVYVNGTTSLEKCFLFHVVTG